VYKHIWASYFRFKIDKIRFPPLPGPIGPPSLACHRQESLKSCASFSFPRREKKGRKCLRSRDGSPLRPFPDSSPDLFAGAAPPVLVLRLRPSVVILESAPLAVVLVLKLLRPASSCTEPPPSPPESGHRRRQPLPSSSSPRKVPCLLSPSSHSPQFFCVWIQK
jgi:hypothetical protein